MAWHLLTRESRIFMGVAHIMLYAQKKRQINVAKIIHKGHKYEIMHMQVKGILCKLLLLCSSTFHVFHKWHVFFYLFVLNTCDLLRNENSVVDHVSILLRTWSIWLIVFLHLIQIIIWLFSLKKSENKLL